MNIRLTFRNLDDMHNFSDACIISISKTMSNTNLTIESKNFTDAQIAWAIKVYNAKAEQSN